MDKIKFDEIYDGEWPYSSHDGVGVHFIGTPNDEVKFVEILQSYSCNPIISHRICDILVSQGERLTTTRPHLDFNQINREISKLGVYIKICKPLVTETHDNYSTICSQAVMYYGKMLKDPEDAKMYYKVLNDDRIEDIIKNAKYLEEVLKKRPASLKPYYHV